MNQCSYTKKKKKKKTKTILTLPFIGIGKSKNAKFSIFCSLPAIFWFFFFTVHSQGFFSPERSLYRFFFHYYCLTSDTTIALFVGTWKVCKSYYVVVKSWTCLLVSDPVSLIIHIVSCNLQRGLLNYFIDILFVYIFLQVSILAFCSFLYSSTNHTAGKLGS